MNEQKEFKSGDMIACVTPRGTSVAILAEDFTYEKPCMVACKSMLAYDGSLCVVGEGVSCDLYIHQDAIDVRLANEKEGLMLFSAMKMCGAEKKKEAKFDPKDGDFLYKSEDGMEWIILFCREEGGLNPFKYYAMLNADGVILLSDECVSDGWIKADESKKQLLLSALAKENKRWNAEKKRIENVPWRAEKGGEYYAASFIGHGEFFCTVKYTESNDTDDNRFYGSGRYFQSESDCQLLCDQLNAVLEQNKEAKLTANIPQN